MRVKCIIEHWDPADGCEKAPLPVFKPEPHPDTAQDYHRLKAIEKGGKQAIETSAINAMYDAIDRGESKEEAEKVFFSFFNKQSYERQ